MSKQQRIFTGFGCVLIAALALMYLGFFDGAERALLDAEFRYLRANYRQPVEKDVVVIGIDEATLAAQPEPFALWHPHLGLILNGLTVAKPAVVGLDIPLPVRSFDFLIPQYDKPLLDGIAGLSKVTPVVLAQTLDDRGNQRIIFPPYLVTVGPDAVGPVIVCRDADRIVRRYDERECSFGPSRTSFANLMVQRLGIKKKFWRGFINYGLGDAIIYIPGSKVLEWSERNDTASLIAAFRGKPVIVGQIQPFADRFPLPVALAAFEPETRLSPGLLIQVQALRSMLGAGLIAPFSESLTLVLAAAASLFWFGAGSWRKLFLFAIAVAALIVIATLLLARENVQFPAGSLASVAFLALAARAAYEAFLKTREHYFLRKAFVGYVNPWVLRKILRGSIHAELSGTRQRVCVMFCNIRGFTSRAERMAPDAVIKLLNDYFSGAVSAVHKHEGTTSKLSGDRLIAFFGAPQLLANPEKNALEASQEVLENLARLNEQLTARGMEPLTLGIGLHSGEVVLGRVGTLLHHEYTAIGNVLNVASQLEQAAAELDYPVVCTADVADAVNRAGGIKDLGERALYGHPAVRVFGWRPRLLSAS
jgi:class 3 adenylate cyclase